MKVDVQVGLGPGHIVLDEDSAPSLPKGTEPSPNFQPYICCGQMAVWIKMPLGLEEGLSPCDFVFDPSPKGGGAPSPIFGPCPLWPNGWMGQDGIWHRVGPWPRLHYARLGPSSPPKKGGGAPSPILGPFLLWPNGWMHQDAT